MTCLRLLQGHSFVEITMMHATRVHLIVRVFIVDLLPFYEIEVATFA
jgi:hypothetical protein